MRMAAQIFYCAVSSAQRQHAFLIVAIVDQRELPFFLAVRINWDIKAEIATCHSLAHADEFLFRSLQRFAILLACSAFSVLSSNSCERLRMRRRLKSNLF